MMEPLSDEPDVWASVPLASDQAGQGRRDLRSLPDGFVGRLVEHYCPLVMRRLARFRNLLSQYVGDDEDLRQQAIVWLLTAAETYDPARRVVFGAYLTHTLRHRPIDFVRNCIGRGPSDWKTRIGRAREEFIAVHHRLPSARELADLLGAAQSAVEYWERRVAVVTSSYHPIDLTESGFESAMPVWSVEAVNFDSVTIVHEHLIYDQLIAALLTCARGKCDKDDTVQDLLVTGWAAWYLTTFSQLTKTDLVELSGVSHYRLAREMSRLRARVRTYLGQDFAADA